MMRSQNFWTRLTRKVLENHNPRASQSRNPLAERDFSTAIIELGAKPPNAEFQKPSCSFETSSKNGPAISTCHWPQANTSHQVKSTRPEQAGQGYVYSQQQRK